MSRSLGRRRKSSLKVVSPFKEPPGPILKFRWSVSAAHLASLEDNSPVIFPSVNVDQSQKKLPSVYSTWIGQGSVSNSSASTYKTSPLPTVNKQSQSPMSTERKKNSPQRSPLSLSYAQVYRASPSSRIQRSKQARLSIYPVSNDKRTSMSMASSNLSFISRPSFSTTTPLSLLPINADGQLPNGNFLRLQTSELRCLNVSEKYIDEAKKLYFNVNCRSFVPRTEVF